MRSILSSVLWRYIAIAVQFGIVVLITQHVDVVTAGRYFAIFGLVTVAAVAVGLGLPDGFVKFLPQYRSGYQTPAINSLVLRTSATSLGISLAIGTIVHTLASCFARIEDDSVITLTILWWLAYSAVFLFAQLLVGLGRPGSGAFVAYSSITLAYLFSLAPYILFATNPTLGGVLAAANVGAWSAAAVGGALAALSSRRCQASARGALKLKAPPEFCAPTPRILEMLKTGMPIMAGRLMQATFPWTPVWILIAVASAEEAAIYGAASRLTVAVTSVVAAMRFSVRPTIVELSIANRFKDIVTLNRKCSVISAVPPTCGIAILAFAGDTIIPTVLGPDYAAVTGVLIILMAGVLAEAFGGLSDEILKMTGRTRIVLATQLCAMTLQVSICSLFVSGGANAVAVGTAIAFAAQYGLQVAWLSVRTEIHILPLPRGLNERTKQELL